MASFAKLRAFALALPGAVEIVHKGEPWFNVGRKTFALRSNGKVIMKLERGHQEMLFELRPEVFTPCPVATVKWSYVDIGKLTPAETRALVEEAWAQIVPKKISRGLRAPASGMPIPSSDRRSRRLRVSGP
ncbi:MAG TPA: MmcQ/YjbR family DNA-binding protein [Rhizomicrobium sp.]|nr:MmcQ/YjbR family DNA-binding protein [Rhizomicrobium sp.]